MHEKVAFEGLKPLFDDDKYLKPFLEEDSLLYRFSEDEEGEDDWNNSIEEEGVMGVSKNLEDINIDYKDDIDNLGNHVDIDQDGVSPVGGGQSSSVSSIEMASTNGMDYKEHAGPSERKLKGDLLKASSENDIGSVNKNYFGAYSSFGIHREMLSDKV